MKKSILLKYSLLVLLMGLCMVSCSSDDDEDYGDDVTISTTALNGTWTVQSYTIIKGKNTIENESIPKTITFNSNQTLTTTYDKESLSGSWTLTNKCIITSTVYGDNIYTATGIISTCKEKKLVITYTQLDSSLSSCTYSMTLVKK